MRMSGFTTSCSTPCTTSNWRMCRRLWKLFGVHEGEAQRLIDLWPKSPTSPVPDAAAYDHVLNCSDFSTCSMRGERSASPSAWRDRPRSQAGRGRGADLERAAERRRGWRHEHASPFLLEIGTEEIPDWMIVSALNQLQDHFQSMLDGNALGGRVAWTEATPRRLALRADGIIERQADAEELVMGPPKSAGPGAAAGFAEKMGVKADALGAESTAKGEYLSFRKKVAGKASRDILAAELPALVLKIQWPKTMYWTGKGGPRFIRPIRWIVALLGDDVVPFEIAGVASGNITRGHRKLAAASIPVTVENYRESLAASGVILSANDRREKIEVEIAALLEATGLHVRPDPDLLNTLVYITEFPTPIIGSFDAQYLELPSEVLVTVMRHHQKYFSVEEATENWRLGSLL